MTIIEHLLKAYALTLRAEAEGLLTHEQARMLAYSIKYAGKRARSMEPKKELAKVEEKKDFFTYCVQCRTGLHLEALQSAAGWYAGTFCPNCGPHSRESYGYYATKEEAQKEVDFMVLVENGHGQEAIENEKSVTRATRQDGSITETMPGSGKFCGLCPILQETIFADEPCNGECEKCWNSMYGDDCGDNDALPEGKSFANDGAIQDEKPKKKVKRKTPMGVR